VSNQVWLHLVILEPILASKFYDSSKGIMMSTKLTYHSSMAKVELIEFGREGGE